MRHLVLGGGGFIGSHLVRRLVREGHDVTFVDVRFPYYRTKLWEGATPCKGDLRDPQVVQNVMGMQAHAWDMVWQLAADMGGVEYFHGDFDWIAAVNNQLINTQVMKYSIDYGVKRVLFTSTACALATQQQSHNIHRPLAEHDLNWGTPDQLYGQEKRNSAIMWSTVFMDSRVVFLHTVYGPFQEYSGIRMKFPMAVAQKARKARETGVIELLGDGRQVRTFMYIKDAIDRLMAVGQAENVTSMYNIGGVTSFTCDEVAEIAGWHAVDDPDRCSPYEIRHIPGPTGVEHRTCSMARFEEDFPGYKYRTLDWGMRKMIKWLDEND